MSRIAVHAEGISKEFRIGRKQDSYRTLRDAISDAFVSPFRKTADLLKGRSSGAAGLDQQIWALRDITFDVDSGEVVGIIGRNGAGKSTLLKVLSRITEPTTGHVEIRGRVGSLLEVGTGFHQELTGRENIYLNGAILGMSRTEINRKFDEIVEFAEVEKFIDTPVKHYSSGMYLRLAFAVAAHLEPEILIVDEVLAVGDARFQKKCLNKMQDVGQDGRTVLFVSHNMPAITRLCGRAILLEGGKILKDGRPHDIVGTYLSSGIGTTAAREWPDLQKAPGRHVVKLRAVRVRAQDGKVCDLVDIRQPMTIEMEYTVILAGYILVPNLELFNEENISVFSTLDQDPGWRQKPRPKGDYISTVRIPGNLLSEGIFYISCYISSSNPFRQQCAERDAVSFQVFDTIEGNSARGDWTGQIDGVVRPLLKWNTQFHPNGRVWIHG